MDLASDLRQSLSLQTQSPALFETFLGMPLFTLTRFGRWEQILAEPRPPANTRYWTGVWHYAYLSATKNSAVRESTNWTPEP